nr:ADP-ribosylation factor-like protein 6-interacting protein 4 isoform X2 [Saimiri boliviensis boliviensis]
MRGCGARGPATTLASVGARSAMAHMGSRKRSRSRSRSRGRGSEKRKKKSRKDASRNCSASESQERSKHKARRRPRSSSSSSSSSTSSSSSSLSSSSSSSGGRKKRGKHKDKKRKKKKKKKKKRKKLKKKGKEKAEAQQAEALPGPSLDQWHRSAGEEEDGPVLTDEQKSRIQAMKPMTKEEWDARQSVIRKVVDPETGRTRLIKGDGEVLEEIVTKERHKEINKQATRGDGLAFQMRAGLLP